MKNCLFKKLIAGFLAFTLLSISPIQTFAMEMENESESGSIIENTENNIEQEEPDADTGENLSADKEIESIEQDQATVLETEEKIGDGELEDKPKTEKPESISEKQEDEIIRTADAGESAGVLRQLTYYPEAYEMFCNNTTKESFLSKLTSRDLYMGMIWYRYAYIEETILHDQPETAYLAFVDEWKSVSKTERDNILINADQYEQDAFDKYFRISKREFKEYTFDSFRLYMNYIQTLTAVDLDDIIKKCENLESDSTIKAEEEFITYIQRMKDDAAALTPAMYAANRAVTPEGVDTLEKIKINIHDYQDTDVYDNMPPSSQETLNHAINRNREFLFQYYVDDFNINGKRRWWNNYHVTPATTIPEKYQKGIVAPKLVNGYPVLSNTASPGVSLDYLFNGKDSAGVIGHYNNLNKLFLMDDNGMYSIKSNEDQVVLQPDGTFSHYKVNSEAQFLPLNRVTSRNNYWFGMDITTQFAMPENKQINGKDMVFEFSGDDDLWVFVDDVLVLDLGGIHCSIKGSINFTTGSITEGYVFAPYDLAKDESEFVFDTRKTSIASRFKQAGSVWDDSENTTHTMKIFYLERGTGGSRCVMNFNLPVQKVDPEPTYKVNYNANGGLGSMSPDSVKYNENYTAKDNEYSNAGYQFVGWNTDPNGNGDSWVPGVSKLFTYKKDITLYAQWEKIDYGSYNVRYNSNGGMGYMPNSTYKINEYGYLRENTFVRSDYKFLGWSTDSSAENPTYYDMSRIYNLTTEKDAIVDLYAIWEYAGPTSYTVTYKPNTGDGVNQTQSIIRNSNWLTKGAIFTKDGHELESWNTKSDGSGIRYELNAFQNPLTEDLILYAQWKVTAPPTITVGKEKIFWEGTTVDREDLLKNVTATDPVDGDITNRIKITKIEYSAGRNTNEPGYVKEWKDGMLDTDLLDTWFMELPKELSPVKHVVTYEVTANSGLTTKATQDVYVKYNEFPTIYAEDRYFTLEEAQAGKITDKVLREDAIGEGKISANDTEEGDFSNTDKITLLDFDPEEFKAFTDSGYRRLTLHVQDTYGPDGKGKETTRQFVVYIIKDGEVPDVEKAKKVRFINEKYYDKNKSINPDNLTAEEKEIRNANGGLHVESKWYRDPEYRTLVENTFVKTSGKIYRYTYEDVEQICAYIDAHGIGNSQDDNALNEFIHLFMEQ